VSVDKLFQPLRLGGLMLPNRVIMTTVKLGYSDQKGEVTDLEVYVIGDAVEPRKALDTIHKGFEVGNKV
jgi:2,4-dienoyl-CoA reductase-like NADH-dependent reductase (Old Yellow Enzyme family)